MQNKLDEIVAHKRQELLERKVTVPESILFAQLQERDHDERFFKAITAPQKGDIGLIAEIKQRSPSAGVLAPENDSAEQRAMSYMTSGADAISYVSDEEFFGGTPEMIRTLRRTVDIPILQKDFVIDNYQIVEAANNSADALLLIARILDMRTLNVFVELAYLYGMEPVVEVYDEKDLEKALESNARLIGVNARNLDTFEVSIPNACQLSRTIPKDRVVIGFSGVETRDDILAFKEAGAKAVLVGTTLMKAKNIVSTVTDLKGI